MHSNAPDFSSSKSRRLLRQRVMVSEDTGSERALAPKRQVRQGDVAMQRTQRVQDHLLIIYTAPLCINKTRFVSLRHTNISILQKKITRGHFVCTGHLRFTTAYSEKCSPRPKTTKARELTLRPHEPWDGCSAKRRSHISKDARRQQLQICCGAASRSFWNHSGC